MARTFLERALQAISSGNAHLQTWNKTIPAASGTLGDMNHLFQYAGYPSAGVYTGTALAAIAVTGGDSPSLTTGIFTVPNPRSNEQGFLYGLDCYNGIASLAGVLVVGDLLAYYQGFATTAPIQATTVTPNVGDLILPRYTDGEGVMIFADVQTTLGATPSALVVNYTNQDGLTGATNSTTLLTGAVQGKLAYSYANNSPFMRLASGDRGVKSIQSADLTNNMVGGTFALCLFKPFFSLPVVQQTATTHNFGKWEGFDNLEAVLLATTPALTMLWIPGATAVGTLSGSLKKLDVRTL